MTAINPDLNHLLTYQDFNIKYIKMSKNCNRHNFSKFIRSLDKTGSDIKFNIAGEDTYKTNIGALMSILANIFLLYWSFHRVHRFV